MIENRKDDAIENYADAAALAVANRDWFALDSTSQQLDFLGELEFQSEIVAEAAAVIDRAESNCTLCSAAVRKSGRSRTMSSCSAAT